MPSSPAWSSCMALASRFARQHAFARDSKHERITIVLCALLPLLVLPLFPPVALSKSCSTPCPTSPSTPCVSSPLPPPAPERWNESSGIIDIPYYLGEGFPDAERELYVTAATEAWNAASLNLAVRFNFHFAGHVNIFQYDAIMADPAQRGILIQFGDYTGDPTIPSGVAGFTKVRYWADRANQRVRGYLVGLNEPLLHGAAEWQSTIMHELGHVANINDVCDSSCKQMMYGCDMENPPTIIDNLAIATLACKYGWADEGTCAQLFGVDWSEDDSLLDALAKASCDCSGSLRTLSTASLLYEFALSENGGPYEPLATVQEEDWVNNTYTPVFDHPISNARVRMRVFDGGSQVGEAYTGARDVGQLVSVPPAVAKGFHLDGSNPNPSRGSTTIGFRLQVAGHVSLEVVDIAGRRIATLVDRTLEAGLHRYVWDGRGAKGDVPPGVYLCRLRQGRAVDTRTIIRCR